MQAEIITIGTELLLGQILDTNSSWLGKELAELGIDLYKKQTVGDNKKRLSDSIQSISDSADLIITTGGLGPTQDDITREAVALALDLELEMNDDCLAKIRNYFVSKGRGATENNKKQAYLPKGAKVIENFHGTAPGFIVEFGDKIIISLPGVPSEMKAMVNKDIIPYLEQKTNRNKKVIKSRVIKTCGIGESSLETEIADILRRQDNPTIALLASAGEVKIRITAKAKNKKEADDLIEAEISKLKGRIAQYIYGYDNSSLEGKVAKLLWQHELKLAVAESCTGGLIADRLTNVSGSSKYFDRGVVSYSNQSKIELLDVNKETLKKHGAVSEEVARQMALGIQKKSNTQIGIATTGIAGPTGGSKEKPVGLVYMAIVINDKLDVYRYNFSGDREKIKYLTSQNLLVNLRKKLRLI